MSARGGIDLGGTKIQAVIVNSRGTVGGDARRPTPTTGGPRAVTAEMAATLLEAAESAGLDPAKLVSVGVGSPGIIDARKGTVENARNLSEWIEPFSLARHLGKAVGAPVAIGNDVQVATDAEFKLGAGKPYKSVLGVFWGTGVGGGIVLDGRPWTGRGAAGEIGHIVVKKDGAQCPCGRYGCLEAYAGRAAMEAKARHAHEKDGRKTSLFKIMEKKGRTRLTSGVWARAVEDGDELANELVDRAIEYLGAGIASAVNLLDVDAVVLGGGLGVRFGPDYLDRLRKAMMPHVFADERPPELHVAALGDLGGAIGAALLTPARPRPARRTAGGSARSRARR